MLKSYLMTAIRSLVRQKGYFILNTLGLAIGLSSFIFILLYVLHEQSYDRFHKKYNRIYRVIVEGKMSGQDLYQAVTAAPMAEAMKLDYPEVESVVRLTGQGAWLMQYGESRYNEDDVLFADSSLFEVFDFKLLKGDPATCLKEPRSLVLTESTALKYFGGDEAIGKYIRVEDDTIDYTVTGVIEDSPGNTHIPFEILASASTLERSAGTNWISHNFWTYIVLNEGVDPATFELKMVDMITKYVGPQIEQFLGINLEQFSDAGNYFGYRLQPLKEIHLHSNLQYELQPNGNQAYVYIFSMIGILVLVIGIINFINLTTAKSATRAKEVGIRKVAGSDRKNIIFQFLGESFVLTFIAAFIAVVLVELFTPAFYRLIGIELTVNLFNNMLGIPLLVILTIIVGFLAGIYPAFIIATFKPVDVIKGNMSNKAMSGWLRNLLIVFQFTISIVIIIGTIIVYNQLNFMQGTNLGFSKEQLLVVRRVDALDNQLESFKEELYRNPAVSAVANSQSIPGKPGYSNNGMQLVSDPEQNTHLLHQNWVSYNYTELLGLELIKGRFFSPEYGGDTASVIINEEAVRILGIEEEPLAEILRTFQEQGEFMEMKIVGIIKNHRIKSLHHNVEPVALSLMPGNYEGFLLIRIGTNEISKTVRFVEDTWDQYVDLQPFEYFFFDDDYNELYMTELKTGHLLIVFAILAIFIASLGLLGMISYSVSIRRKEIGIRKVFGADIKVIIRILSMSTIRLILVATLLGWPLAFFGARYWLLDFASRVAINPLIFLIASSLTITVGWLVISIQTIRAARANPVNILYYE